MTRTLHRTAARTAAPGPTVATLALAFAAVLSAAAPGPVTAADVVAELDRSATEVRFIVEATGHDVHGSFGFEQGAIRFDPTSGEASGNLVIDATAAETGNGSRDKTMHQKVLESDRYPRFVFHAERVTGALAPTGESTLEIRGSMEIHGSEHPFTLPVTVTRDGDRFTATSTFTVPYVEWGLHNPGFLFLRVADEVEVTVASSGTLRTAPEVAPDEPPVETPDQTGEAAPDGR